MADDHVKCPNYLLCQESIPQWMIDSHGTCITCDMKYGEWNNGNGALTFTDAPEECIICCENGILVTQPSCSHQTCITCFRKLYDKESLFPEPSLSGWVDDETYDNFMENTDHAESLSLNGISDTDLACVYRNKLEILISAGYEEFIDKISRTKGKCPFCRSSTTH